MSEIDNNLNVPFQTQNNNQNQEDHNQSIQNNSLLPVNESHNIYQDSQPIHINEENQQLPIDNTNTQNNNIFVKSNPNELE